MEYSCSPACCRDPSNHIHASGGALSLKTKHNKIFSDRRYLLKFYSMFPLCVSTCCASGAPRRVEARAWRVWSRDRAPPLPENNTSQKHNAVIARVFSARGGLYSEHRGRNRSTATVHASCVRAALGLRRKITREPDTDHHPCPPFRYAVEPGERCV